MAILDLLTLIFCSLAVIMNAVAVFVLLKKKSGKDIPSYSVVFAMLSFIFLIVGCFGYLLSAYAVVLPATVFLSAACLILHFLTESPPARPEEQETEREADFEGLELGDAESQSAESLLKEDLAAAFTSDEQESLLKTGREFIAHISESMSGDISLDRLLDFTNQSLIQNTEADGGIIFLVDDYEDILNAKAFSGQFPPPYKLPDDLPHKQVRVEASLRHVQLPFEGNIFGEAAVSGDALYIRDGAADSRVYVNGPEDFLKPGSYIIAPLSIKDKVVGIAALARLPQSAPFSEKDFKTAKTLANYAAAAVNNVYSFQEIMEHAELERSSEVAAEIQKNIQPKQLPDLPEIGFGFFSQSARGVCADYCDVILARRDRIALVMADVAGKGIVSGMVMMSLRAILHLVTNTTKSAATILEWVNRGITDKANVDHYATLAYVSYSMETRELEYSNAGHQPMLIWRAAEKKTEPVHIASDPIGVERGSEYKEMNLTIMPGDIIILYTDGLVETLNAKGEQYGIAGLSKVISENETASAKDIAAAVKHDLKDFIGSAALHDDQTLLVMKIKM